jgi:hypothetical protein
MVHRIYIPLLRGASPRARLHLCPSQARPNLFAGD